MADLVGTCPKGFWEEWIAEGDAAGDPETGQFYEWHTRSPMAARTGPLYRFYIVAHGKLRGYAPVVRVHGSHGAWCIYRAAGAVACTIDEPIPGFRGLRERWWPHAAEKPFPDWRKP